VDGVLRDRLQHAKNRIRKMILLGIRQFGDPYYQGFAAQVSFYLLLSIVPTVMLVTQLLSLMDISTSALKDWLSHYANDVMGQMIVGFLSNRLSAGTNIVLIILAVWSASRAQFCLMRISNYIYSGGRMTGRFIPERWRSVKLMFLTIFTYAFVVAVLVYGKTFLQLILRNEMTRAEVSKYWSILRWPIAAVMYYFLVFYNYYVMPIMKLEGRRIAPGALFAAAGMLIVTIIYAIYAGNIANYNIIYGSMATVAALLFWLYFMSWVMTLGMLFNKLLIDTSDM
jgi:membrane protein